MRVRDCVPGVMHTEQLTPKYILLKLLNIKHEKRIFRHPDRKKWKSSTSGDH